jgi:hypothetical protein
LVVSRWENLQQIDHILVERRRHSSVLDVQSYRAADCDRDHYLVVAKVRERLAVNKQRSHRFHMKRFNLKKVESKEKYCVEVSNWSAALEFGCRGRRLLVETTCSYTAELWAVWGKEFSTCCLINRNIMSRRLSSDYFTRMFHSK